MGNDSRKRALVELLGRLVACPSVNPGRRVYSDPGYGERQMAGLLAPLLHSWGAATQLVELAPGRHNMVATWQGKRSDQSLLLDAHMDTVGVEGMTIPPFEPRVREGRLYGRGACDTKGPMAAMLLAVRKILDEDGTLPLTLHFAATGDEEDGAMGAARLVESGFSADAAIVAEPTEMKIVYAHKGTCRFRLKLRGKAAHSSVPWLGVNAVEAAADLVCRVRRDYVSVWRQQHHPELGDATLCVSTISGGTRVNIVPDQCEVELDCRCLPGERQDYLEAAMGMLLDKVIEAYPGLYIECEVFQWYPALSGRGTDPFVSQMTEACGVVTGVREAGTAPYATNAGFFSQRNIPCIVFGPGSIAQAHTAGEFIELSQVEQAVDVYARMIRSLGAQA